MTSKVNKPWREAASLILTARCPSKDFDYQVLMLKRSGKSKSFPNHRVFPGGVLANSDSSDGWANLFSQATGSTISSILQQFTRNGPTPPILETKGSSLPAELSFKICAIRETFEETGVLLVKSQRECNISDAPTTNLKKTLHLENLASRDAVNLSEWRKRVNSDATQFLTLCQTLEVVPDIWAIHEWSNWLTPAGALDRTPKRFDTLFYICCMESMPEVAPDDAEITLSHWGSPSELLDAFYRGELYMISPQVYELSRLHNFHEIMDLSRFSHKREIMGIERWMLYAVFCQDGLMILIPGDEDYPVTVDCEKATEVQSLPETYEELRKKTKNRNRVFYRRGGVMKATLDSNVQPSWHISPVLRKQNTSGKL